MKKTLYSIGLILVCSLVFTGVALAAQSIPEYKIIVNGEPIVFPDAKPFADEAGRIQVPVRFIAEALGVEVAWHQDTQTVEFYKFEDNWYTFYLTMTIGQDWYRLWATDYEMDTVAIAKDGRVYAPIRYVAQAFGVGVQWDGNLKAVVIGGEPDPNDMPKIKYFPVETTGGYKFTTATLLGYEDYYGIGGKAVTFTIDNFFDEPEEREQKREEFLSIIENSDANKASKGAHLKKAEELLKLLDERDGTSDQGWYVTWTDADNQLHVMHGYWDEWEAQSSVTIYVPGFDPREPHAADVKGGDGKEPLSISKYFTEDQLTQALKPQAMEVFRAFAEYLKSPEGRYDRFSAFLDKNLSDQEDHDPRDNREKSEFFFENGKRSYMFDLEGEALDELFAKIGDAILEDVEDVSLAYVYDYGNMKYALVHYSIEVTVDDYVYILTANLGFYISDQDPERMVLVLADAGILIYQSIADDADDYTYDDSDEFMW